MPDPPPDSVPAGPVGAAAMTPRNGRVARLVLLATGVVALAVIAFVAFGSSGNATLDPVAQAATVSANTPGFAMKMTMRIQAGSLPNPITGTGSGTFNTQSHQGSMSMTMNTPQGAISLQELLDGHTIYVKLPSSVTSALPGGKPWVSLDLSKLGSIPGASALMSNPTSSNPSEMLQYLRAVSDSVVAVGSQRIDGVETKDYRAQIDFDKVPDALPSSLRGDAQKAITAIEGQTGLHVVPVDVWVDSHHLVRRMTMSFNASAPTAQTLSESFTIDFLKYGPQPKPALPPASEVTDLSSMLGSGG